MDCKFRTQLGLVTVDEDVIVKVAGYAALECYGIVGMAAKRSTDGIVQLMGRENLGRGVRIQAMDDSVIVDLYIIVEYRRPPGLYAPDHQRGRLHHHRPSEIQDRASDGRNGQPGQRFDRGYPRINAQFRRTK